MHTEIDLKLLKVINTLVVSGSVTKTAQLLNLSPGTISYALKKARSITGAHLFIRTKSGMKPDTTARELSQRYQKFTGVNSETAETDETESGNRLTFMTYSPVEMMIACAVKERGPREKTTHFSFLPYDSNVNHRLEKLKNGQVDIDIGAKLPADPLINKIKLFSCPVSVLVNRNTSLDTELTLDEWQSRKHAVWSVLADYYTEDIATSQEVMKHIGERKVAMISASIINMVTFCASSDCIMMIPDYFTRTLTSVFSVKRLAMPRELAIRYDCYIHFNRQLTENEELMTVISDIVTQLTSGILRNE
ncbi:MAG: LysR family transcriptional regulator [Scandinavium sp.]|uniref:LysR family transcriptional regulator n=1 Tax=Scandinavium sp. TaxID=2830653 RepID=UPI003F2B8B9A